VNIREGDDPAVRLRIGNQPGGVGKSERLGEGGEKLKTGKLCIDGEERQGEYLLELCVGIDGQKKEITTSNGR